jgi:CDP-4-dehydro-6-deoxyglucose reductase, E3
VPILTFEGKTYDCKAGEKVLDCLLRHGVMLPSSCRSGVCQTCLVRAAKGTVPAAAQNGIRDTLREQHYFLACICEPEGDLEISLVESALVRHRATLTSKQLLNDSVVRLRLACDTGFEYRAGQFINLLRPGDEIVRSYSRASLPEEGEIELHVKRIPNGKMSNWLFDSFNQGDSLEFHGPAGDCFYLPSDLDAGLLLIGTGTGLAPLYGIVRDAIAQGHRGPIRLFHASLATPGLYMVDTLRALAGKHAGMRYTPCVLHGESPEGGLQGNIVDLVRDEMPSLSGWRVFLCGDPPIVDALKRMCFLAGARITDIYSDPFVFAPSGI